VHKRYTLEVLTWGASRSLVVNSKRTTVMVIRYFGRSVLSVVGICVVLEGWAIKK
ncbi:hypothetical protein THOM_2169, partial [Trachipleistophora hominis]